MTSTSTLLELGNRIADTVSEKQVDALTVPTKSFERKLRNAILRAHNVVVNRARWKWLRKSAVASSWSTDEATVTDMKTLYNIIYTYNDSSLVIPQVGYHQFDNRAIVSYTTNTSRPLYFVQSDANKFRFNPYPADAESQAEIQFNYVFNPVFPATDSGTFECPELYLDIIQLKASALLAAEHMHNANLANYFTNEYETTIRERIAQEINSNQLNNWFGSQLPARNITDSQYTW